MYVEPSKFTYLALCLLDDLRLSLCPSCRTRWVLRFLLPPLAVGSRCAFLGHTTSMLCRCCGALLRTQHGAQLPLLPGPRRPPSRIFVRLLPGLLLRLSSGTINWMSVPLRRRPSEGESYKRCAWPREVQTLRLPTLLTVAEIGLWPVLR